MTHGQSERAVVDAIEAERRLIATALHDEPIQLIGAAALQLELIRATLAEGSQVRSDVEEVLGAVSDAARRLRELMGQLTGAPDRPLAERLALALSGIGREVAVEVDPKLVLDAPDASLVVWAVQAAARGACRRGAPALTVVVRSASAGQDGALAGESPPDPHAARLARAAGCDLTVAQRGERVVLTVAAPVGADD